ncbi:MAG: Zn-ribbon domain-containing OB-fold protein [Thermoplasmata archaeon]|nr:Zn-ribbon domain-containing OB-fold protein [Thermoplasmata archaeon]
MQSRWPGTPLTAADIAEGKVSTAEWRPEAKYAWSTGESIGRFLAELKEGRLVGRKCVEDDKVFFPPRSFCQEHFVRTGEFVRLKNTGKVETYSISYLGTDARRLKEPILVAVISIDGAAEGMGLMHYLGEVDPQDVAIGMRVKAVWKPKAEREGSVLDIRHFKPV